MKTIVTKYTTVEQYSATLTLHTHANWTMTHVGATRLFNGVIIDINNLVQIFRHDLGDL